MKKDFLIAFASLCISANPIYADFSPAELKFALHENSPVSVVASFVEKSPSDAALIVKQVIIETEATVEQVAAIVRVAIQKAPNEARIIYLSALAVAPDAHDEVLKVYYELLPSSGEGANDAKGGKISSIEEDPTTQVGSEAGKLIAPNPLDFPVGNFAGANVSGPTLGGPGGFPLIGIVLSPLTLIPTGPPVPICPF
jgi:hypothetical protein